MGLGSGVPIASVSAEAPKEACRGIMANLRTKILGFGGFDPSRVLILRGGVLMSTGTSLELLSQAILVGMILHTHTHTYTHKLRPPSCEQSLQTMPARSTEQSRDNRER